MVTLCPLELTPSKVCAGKKSNRWRWSGCPGEAVAPAWTRRRPGSGSTSRKPGTASPGWRRQPSAAGPCWDADVRPPSRTGADERILLIVDDRLDPEKVVQ